MTFSIPRAFALSLLFSTSILTVHASESSLLQNKIDNLSPKHWRSIQKSIGESFEQAFIKASNTNARDEFSRSIAFSGNTLVVGAPGEDSLGIEPPKNANGDIIDNNGQIIENYIPQKDNSAINSGAAYVFIKDQGKGGRWVQQAYLKVTQPSYFPDFGRLVAIDGDTIIVVSGHSLKNAGSRTLNKIHIFQRKGEVWNLEKEITSNYVIHSIALSHHTLVVGSYNREDETGIVETYDYTENDWVQDLFLKGSDMASFGFSVAFDGQNLVVGAPAKFFNLDLVEDKNDLPYQGKVFIFNRKVDGEWSKDVTTLEQSERLQQFFGFKVALSNKTVAVGGFNDGTVIYDINTQQSTELVYIFDKKEGEWTQSAKLQASNGEIGDNFGKTLALSGDTLVVGAENEDGQNSQDDNNAPDSGAAYVFTRQNGIWTQQVYLKAPNIEQQDHFASDLILDNNLLISSVIGDDSDATGTLGEPMTDNNAEDSGAVYSIELDLSETRRSNIIFDWIERFFANLFPNFLKTFDFKGYLVRGPYERTGNYVGTKNGKLYVFGEQWGGLFEVGEVDDFYQQAIKASSN